MVLRLGFLEGKEASRCSVSPWDDRFCKKCGGKLVPLFTTAECPTCEKVTAALTYYYCHPEAWTLPLEGIVITVTEGLYACPSFKHAVNYAGQLDAAFIVKCQLLAGNPAPTPHLGWYDLRGCRLHVIKVYEV